MKLLFCFSLCLSQNNVQPLSFAFLCLFDFFFGGGWAFLHPTACFLFALFCFSIGTHGDDRGWWCLFCFTRVHAQHAVSFPT